MYKLQGIEGLSILYIRAIWLEIVGYCFGSGLLRWQSLFNWSF